MTNLSKLKFVALDITGKNYLSWVLDAEHLDANGLGDTIKEGNKTSSQAKAKAMIFLRHHLHEGLKTGYLTIKDPLILWTSIKERYDHQKTIILPKARYDCMHLRFPDFKSVSEYNSAMFRISSQLQLCGEKITNADMLEKPFSTFHASNLLLQQQYREKGFKKYSELISCLLVAEQNNELLMKNHKARPTGSVPFPTVNAVTYNGKDRGHASSRGRGCGRGCGRNNHRGGHFSNTYTYQKWEHKDGKRNKSDKDTKTMENLCYRCGGKGHWSRTCRTPKHLVELYQQSLKDKGKKIETNFASEDGKDETTLLDFGNDDFNYGCVDTTHLDVADFFSNPEENIDH